MTVTFVVVLVAGAVAVLAFVSRRCELFRARSTPPTRSAPSSAG